MLFYHFIKFGNRRQIHHFIFFDQHLVVCTKLMLLLFAQCDVPFFEYLFKPCKIVSHIKPHFYFSCSFL